MPRRKPPYFSEYRQSVSASRTKSQGIRQFRRPDKACLARSTAFAGPILMRSMEPYCQTGWLTPASVPVWLSAHHASRWTPSGSCVGYSWSADFGEASVTTHQSSRRTEMSKPSKIQKEPSPPTGRAAPDEYRVRVEPPSRPARRRADEGPNGLGLSANASGRGRDRGGRR